MEHKFTVSSSPHIHVEDSISSIMLDVIIALIPASICGIYFFGLRALAVIVTAIAACVLSEYAYQKLMKKTVTVRDLSAVVTGLLLALNMPSTIPLWMVATGSAFAVIVVKQLYGGLGKNFLNPALAARCFMLIAWAQAMTTFAEPGTGSSVISSATPLSILGGTAEGSVPTLMQTFLGYTSGCIGETSTLMIIIGFIYMLIKRVISIRIPLTYLLSFGLLMFLFGKNTTGESQLVYTLLNITSGGLMIGAVFMATDYVTTPTTSLGQIIFGLGCGILTFVIRRFGGYPEGASFVILLMNLTTPLIDSALIPRKFGEVKRNA